MNYGDVKMVEFSALFRTIDGLECLKNINASGDGEPPESVEIYLVDADHVDVPGFKGEQLPSRRYRLSHRECGIPVYLEDLGKVGEAAMRLKQQFAMRRDHLAVMISEDVEAPRIEFRTVHMGQLMHLTLWLQGRHGIPIEYGHLLQSFRQMGVKADDNTIVFGALEGT